MSRKLWEKGIAGDQDMQRLTVGNDPVIDTALVVWDAAGSAAHAKMLARIGILSDAECRDLVSCLKEIHQLDRQFEIPYELEDVHTAVENFLVKNIGEPGRRIHAGRSRNDQVMLALRLLMRDTLLQWLRKIGEFMRVVESRFDTDGELQMPGYTHMQPAMPSSAGMWLHCWYEGGLALLKDGLSLFHAMNCSPLGSAAGFGTPLGLDRKYVAELLGFERVQRSFIDVNNSRGRYEERLLRFALDITAMFEKMASDILMFATKEYGFVSLAEEFTTGSSIMPQKKNFDIVELLRGKTSAIRGVLAELNSLNAKLPSSYHRDFQLGKEPLLRGIHTADDAFEMAMIVMKQLVFNKDRMAAVMYPEIYSTYEAYREVRAGTPFRDAYKNAAKKIEDGSINSGDYAAETAAVQREVETDMNEARAETTAVLKEIDELRGRIDKCIAGALEKL